MTTTSAAAVRTATWATIAVHVGAVAVVVALGVVSDGLVVDPLRPVPIATIFALPAVLAVSALRGRTPLLLPAGVSALVLAVVPLSLHSFVLAPAGVVYVVAYGRLSRGGGRRALAAAATCPVLLVGALLVLVLHDDPVCYSRLQSGEVLVDRDPDERALPAGAVTIGPDTDVVEQGCTSDTVVWWEAIASLVLCAGTLAAATVLVPASDRGSPVQRAAR